ncbi:hypothetical protein [Agromyces subbeticus]|uniref:hypothetical protein n=1 Tax=Agromyces subbeticus TaxID=293890 RepID=UPI0012EC6149|nr:hypothetical protein [Agromyces subbeticus]
MDADGDLTVGATVGGNLRGYRLTPEYRELLEDPGVLLGTARLSARQRALLWWMGNHDMVALIPGHAPEEVMDLVPVLRKSFAAVDPLGEEGYRVHVKGAGTFVADELEMRLMPFIDGQRRFSDIAELATTQLLEDEQNRTAIACEEAVQGRTLRESFADAALRLVAHGLETSAISIERPV